ncbi:DUF2935 domain-containing protein [Candidatus Dependentiae bacterium]|nr:DUF2935 domain-containing protein [Candidatus Dependentiae bacterium]
MNFFKILALCSVTHVALFASENMSRSKSLSNQELPSQSRDTQSLSDVESDGQESDHSSEMSKASAPMEFGFKPAESQELSSPERFKQIKASPEVARNETEFWAHQLSEHALFLHLGLEEPQFKKRGLEFHKRFEAFRKNMSDKTINQILPLIKELRAYQMDVITTLKSGKWIGWIFPSWAKHITGELDYFVDKLNNVPYSAEREVKFWDKVNSDHAALEARLLDPKERELSIKADETSQKIAQIATDSEEAQFIKLSLMASKELDAFNKQTGDGIKQNKIQSTIHPMLLEHVMREGKRSIEILTKLQKQDSAKQGQKDQGQNDQDQVDQDEEVEEEQETIQE